LNAPSFHADDWISQTEEFLRSADETTAPDAERVFRAVEQIDRGIAGRRQIGGIDPFRRDHRPFIRALARLQFATLGWMDRLTTSAGDDSLLLFDQRLADFVQVCLERDDQYLSQLLSRADIATGPGLCQMDDFQSDLQWYDTLTSRLRDEPEPDRAYAIKSRLDQLAASIAEDSPDRLDDPAILARASQVRQECRDLERLYLDRRIEDELTYGVGDASPLSLWNRRFQLSRLEADRTAADLSTTKNDRRQTLARLEERQQSLAQLAEDRLLTLEPARLPATLSDLVVAAQEESNDILTLIEDVPLPVAVELLKSNTADFRRLNGTLRTLAARRHESKASRAVADLRRLTRRSKNELQEKRLALRLERIFGRRIVGWIENTILLLILLLTGLILLETILAAAGSLSPTLAGLFAWADLTICSVFLAEFTLKLVLAPDPLRYFRRHFVIDFLASIPFGFITYQAGQMESMAGDASLLRLLRFLRLPQMVRYLRLMQPVVRVGRLVFFLLRTTDRIVRRNAAVFNRNIVLFEPDALGADEPGYRLRLARLREHFSQRMRELDAGSILADRVTRVAHTLAELRERLESIPTTAIAEPVRQATVKRDLYAEEVVRELLEMTPERLVQRLGPRFPESIARCVRFFDVPLVRRLPVIRDLVASLDQGAGHVAALSANYLGYLLRGFLEAGYFLADLHGTISGPIFLDRLGTILVKATSRNANRLLLFGAGVFVLSGLAWLLGVMLLESMARKLRAIFVLPVLILGLACLVLMVFGRWLKWLANQTSEEGERLVEAQFAAQTKLLKRSFVEGDFTFLNERVVLPELTLRSLDDENPSPDLLDPNRSLEQLRRARQATLGSTSPSNPADEQGLTEETLFLRTVSLLHQDYQDSGLFRPSDTKMTTQLLGNMALANLRQSALALAEQDRHQLRRLDAARLAGGLFGGPYLWFNYMTRIITEETAKLLRDYNRHAVPICRLPSASREVRERYRHWLADRLGYPVERVRLPEPVGEFGNAPSPDPESAHLPNDRFETVEFTTMDFLTYGQERGAEIERRFGPELARLLHIDRRRAIRQAFRSFPLHRFPEAYRTVNPLTLYLDFAAGGRVLLLPGRILWWGLRGVGLLLIQIARTVRDVLRPRVSADASVDTDTFAIALRKIHRMRKPGVLASIWMRARFDTEYLGMGIPGVPMTVGSPTLFDDDLNFIGSTRRERLAAERLVIDQRRCLDQMVPTLTRLGLPMEDLRPFLFEHYPYLAHRSAEVMRGLATAWLVNDAGLRDLATSIDAIERLVDWVRTHPETTVPMPSDLPPIRLARPGLANRNWRLGGWWTGTRRLVEEVLGRLSLLPMEKGTRQAIIQYFVRHGATVQDWISAIAALPPGVDPRAVVQARVREVILRTDLWSDQLVVLRTLQTLSLLDVHHYCRVVWNLGGYGERDQVEFPAALPTSDRSRSTAATGP
jgi:hypothetical protein